MSETDPNLCMVQSSRSYISINFLFSSFFPKMMFFVFVFFRSALWESVHTEERTTLLKNKDDGEFWYAHSHTYRNIASFYFNLFFLNTKKQYIQNIGYKIIATFTMNILWLLFWRQSQLLVMSNKIGERCCIGHLRHSSIHNVLNSFTLSCVLSACGLYSSVQTTGFQ